MMRRCLDEGLLQAYLDGELSQELMSEAAAHVAACAACAEALAEAEGESAFFAAAFAPDDSVGVPTAVLRSRLNAAVAQLEAEGETKRAPGRSFGGFLASLSGLFTFKPQTAAAFASLLAVVALAVIYFAVVRQPAKPASGSREIARVEKNSPPAATPESVRQPQETQSSNVNTISDGGQQTSGSVKMTTASFRKSGSRRAVERNPALARPKPAASEVLPGEKEYQTAIASLEKTIKLGGDATLRPAVRASYERDLALLDSAIKQTRRVAAENPKDKDAVGFLMTAYQSKVELLSKVADQAQVAALGR